MRGIVTALLVTLIATTCISDSYAKGWRWQGNQKNTYGWQLMTPEERTEHQTRMRSFTDYNACREYVDEHHKQMEERAREKGITPPVMRRNPCDTMKAKGVFR